MRVDPVIAKQLSSLPIPPAALVIDLRGVDDSDTLLKTLQAEIENLTEEMGMQQVSRWRYLTNFLAFRKFDPLTVKEIEEIRSQEDDLRVKQQRALLGHANQGKRGMVPGKYYEDEDLEPSFLDNIPHDEFRRNIEECSQLIDAIRNERIRAIGDLGTTGRIGRNAMSSKVQVIFLTDAEEPDTLSSAAAYAMHLKYKYSPLERVGQPVLDNVIIALNHNNQNTAPRILINRLRWRQPGDTDEWRHIDALILSEMYGHNVARIHQSVQPDIAELLLYAQLIGQPIEIHPPAPDHTQLFLPPPKTKEVRSLPPRTYLVGLAAIENSVNWGRRLLNFALADEVVHILKDKPFDEQAQWAQTADIWLSDWRMLVESGIPDSIGNVPQLQAFAYSKDVAVSSEPYFTSSRLTIETGRKMAQSVRRYTDEVAQTYTISVDERQEKRKRLLAGSNEQNVTLQPTLENALSSIPQIQQQISTWKDEELETPTPIVQAIHKAERILSEEGFFQGGRGAVPRGKQQLGELARAIGVFQNKLRGSSVNLSERRKSLTELRDQSIEDLERHDTRYPLLAGLLHLKGVLAWLSLLGIEILVGVIVFTFFAWFHYLVGLLLPDIIPTLDQSFLGISVYSAIVWVVLVITDLIVLASVGRKLLNRKRSALSVEFYFCATLVAFGLLGLIVSLSAVLTTIDPAGRLISSLNWLPFLSLLLFTLAVVIVLIEAGYYFSWRRALFEEKRRITAAVVAHQQETAQAVKHYIADTLALELLRRAELTDGKGNVGAYYSRMDALNQLLEDSKSGAVSTQIAEGHQLAELRLTERSNQKLETASTSSNIPTLKIREELLDITNLTSGIKRLQVSLKQKRDEFNEFAEILLRVMGVELPGTVEKELRERAFTEQRLGEQAFQEYRERHYAEILLSTVVASALRMVVAMPTVDIVMPLKERYDELNPRITGQLSGLKPLLDKIQEKMSLLVKDDASDESSSSTSDSEDRERDIALVSFALTVWGQVLWENKDKDIDAILTSNGVMAKLQDKGYDPQTVKALLFTLTTISGISSKRQVGELKLLLFPSSQGKRFFQDMQLEPRYVSIPDAERLVLLYVDQYTAPPIYIPGDENDDVSIKGNGQHEQQDISNGHGTNQDKDDNLNNYTADSVVVSIDEQDSK